MLNISENSIKHAKLDEKYPSFKQTLNLNFSRKLVYWLIFFLIFGGLFMFMPWTQNVRAKGKITTLRPEHRPQNIYPVIPGRIEQWFIREGDTVRMGDTLLRLSEIKVEYFDPNLLERTQDQVTAKEFSVKSYEQKAQALEQQILAMREALKLKLEQANNKILQSILKIKSDSMELSASQTALQIADYQFKRADTLFQQGLKPLTEWEEKRNKAQAALSKQISAENKLLTTKNELVNAQIELNSIRSEYADKIAKAESERFSTLSAIYDATGSVSKLANQLSNYQNRQQFYYILAPQDGIVSKIHKKGIGETLKESEPILSIMPVHAELAVEMYVRPMDYPLLKPGHEVVFIFDGWPAFVFSGWPAESVGTFRGRVVALDNIISENELFRVLVVPDKEHPRKWPSGLRVGAAADGTVLLQDVSLWYELWRQLNGFPPEYYEIELEKIKLKAPVKQLK